MPFDTVEYPGGVFRVYVGEIELDDVPTTGGLYVFAREESDGLVPLYVGQSGNLRKRLATHEKWDETVRLGMTGVHLREVSSRASRLDLEDRIKEVYDPPMNDD